MCLVTFAWESHPQYRLVLAANRDEFHDRPAQAMHWWVDRPALLAGRDLQAGGTWLALHRDGRFATVTNYRDHQRKKAGLESRGKLVTDFAAGTESAATFASAIDGKRYAGFSLLAFDGDELWYVSNRGDGPAPLEAGIYGLSNASLDTPWSKVVRSRAALANLIDTDKVNETSLVRMLGDRTAAPVADVDAGELPFELARALTAPFIVTPDYGTRCTTVITWSHDGEIRVSEHRFEPDGKKSGESSFRVTA